MGLLFKLLRFALTTERPSPPKSRPAPPPRKRQPARTASPPPAAAPVAGSVITGACYVIDGDTIVIGKTRIRLAGIDAPELDHPWGKKSKWALVALCKGQTISAEVTGELSYERVVARCLLPDGRDLSAELVKLGLALDWPKYSGGRYGHLEPEGIRKRLWRAAARQKGRFPR